MQTYDRQGHEIPNAVWSKLFEDDGYAVLKDELLPSKFRVLTIWLGLEHGEDKRGRPLIFETRLYYPDGEPMDPMGKLSATEEEAIAKHKQVSEMYRSFSEPL